MFLSFFVHRSDTVPVESDGVLLNTSYRPNATPVVVTEHAARAHDHQNSSSTRTVSRYVPACTSCPAGIRAYIVIVENSSVGQHFAVNA